MMANEYPLSATFESPLAGAAAAPWLGQELSPESAVVRGKRILLVEDEEPVRACLRLALELDGHQVTEANNGAEALSLFKMGEFDLVITDFEMPVMEGDELAVSIKLLAPWLPILMITGSERTRGDVDNPVDALLNKPFTVADLRFVLRKLLSARSEVAEPRAVLV